eukprot:CAMPEP_0117457572 /NCGR_PEP_ID=MMETSP0784-20121206/476_1 /TAXON_ID=39447 /ORGANISM="" /LENGTH=505 /DNA_ID=CAMNT_0005251047 /DNA_START=123 /DNA_END=1640 /DNA_ORIENTATION=-
MILRLGQDIENIVSAACTQLSHVGEPCGEKDRPQMQATLKFYANAFNVQSAGERAMWHVRMGWDLLQIHTLFDEARLQFMHALAAFPHSTFILQEIAASSMFAASKLKDSTLFAWGPAGTWAYRRPVQHGDLTGALESWECYAAVRFMQPKTSLDESEVDLLSAGAPPSKFIPDGELNPEDSNTNQLSVTLEHRIRHDLQLVLLLDSLNLVAKTTAEAAAAAYRDVLMFAPRVNSTVLQPTQDQWIALYPFFNRRLYVHPNPRAVDPVVSPNAVMQVMSSGGAPVTSLAGGALAGGGILVVDDILTLDALQGLRDFAELSTIWYQERRSYLGAAMGTGFATPLLAQIAQGLRQAFPDILCDLPLANVWAFKFDDELQSGIDIHADSSAVNVNLWITPDENNLDHASGGMVVFDTAATPEQRSIRSETLDRRANVTVTYRQNRAVIFDSARFHTTQTFVFRQGLRKRRINVTFLFGARGAYCPLRRQADLQIVQEHKLSHASQRQL